MKYRILFSDFDNTLLRTDKTVAPETVRAIADYRARGGKFVLVTGRSYESAICQARSLGLEGEVVASMGAVIADIQTGEAYLESGLDNKTAADVARFCDKNEYKVLCYIKRKLYVQTRDEPVEIYESIIKGKATLTKIPLGEYIADSGEVVEKVMVFCLPERAHGIVKQLQQAFGARVSVVMSTDFMVEIINPDYTKGRAIEYMARRYGVPISQTLAVGDSTNDLDMILAAGHGVAVANAMPELRAAADEVTLSCDQNAIGHLIQKYGV